MSSVFKLLRQIFYVCFIIICSLLLHFLLLGAVGYFETSSLYHNGIDETMEAAIRSTLCNTCWPHKYVVFFIIQENSMVFYNGLYF